MTPLTFSLLSETLAVCQLGAGAPLPDLGREPSAFISVTRTRDELSIVCPQERAPAGARVEPGWRALKMEGPFDLSLIGLLAPVAAALAEAKVNIFVVSTFDTYYVLVKENKLPEAVAALTAAGHTVRAWNTLTGP